MPNLLVELGVEDLPAQEAGLLAEAFRAAWVEGLRQARIAHGEVRLYWTLRRLAVLILDVADKQADLVEEVRGPTVAQGLDPAGQPTPAAQGFLRRYGASPEQLVRKKVGEKEYLFLRAETPGRPTPELVSDILGQVFRSLPCSKRMVWDDSGLAFLRPVRWIVCLWGSKALPVQLGQVRGGRETQGHRFLKPGPVTLDTGEAYVDALRAAYVLVDPEERAAAIRQAITSGEREHGVQAALDPELWARMVGSVEWPVGVLGQIPRESLQLPPPVVVAALHEEGKFLPFLRGKEIAPQFLGIAEGVGGSTVRAGYERVVSIRLRDAASFFEQDRSHRLAERVPHLKMIVQEARLGTVWDRVERIRAYSRALARALGLDEAILDRAAYLCKADLATVMVREFPELEGVMGGVYARLDGEPPAVAQAVEEHVLPTARGDELPQSPYGGALSLADKLDFVAGSIRIGEMPTGSRDPYGVRRRAAAVVRLVLEKRMRVDLFALLEAMDGLYPPAVPGATVQDVRQFLVDRLRGALVERGLTHDVVEAVLSPPRGDFLGVWERGQALSGMRGGEELVSLAVGLSRVRNITREHPGRSYDPRLFEEEAERQLFQAYQAVKASAHKAVERHDFGEALRLLLTLRPAIDRYFDEVLVMCEDGAVRANRLSFLGEISDCFLEVADLGKLVLSSKGEQGS